MRTSTSYNSRQLPVSPALLFIQHAGAEDYDPVLTFGKERINDVEDSRATFSKLLVEKIDEIFNPDIAFAPTDDRQRCSNCPYFLLCAKA